jgi:hypothetical protein
LLNVKVRWFISFQAKEEKSVTLYSQRYRHDTILRCLLITWKFSKGEARLTPRSKVTSRIGVAEGEGAARVGSLVFCFGEPIVRDPHVSLSFLAGYGITQQGEQQCAYL